MADPMSTPGESQREASEPRTIRDPHHAGRCSWKVEGGQLYHRDESQSKWTKVERVSFTPARILAIASLLATPEPAEPREEGKP